MHTQLTKLYSAKNGSHFSADQCALIVRELAKLDPSLIPSEQTSNVLDFLNMQLLHQQVDGGILKPIENLTAELAIRLSTMQGS